MCFITPSSKQVCSFINWVLTRGTCRSLCVKEEDKPLCGLKVLLICVSLEGIRGEIGEILSKGAGEIL